MSDIRWQRYPRAAECGLARAWLLLQANLGLAENTVDAYARALEEYLAFSAAKGVPVVAATKDHIAAYVRDLTSRPNPRGANVVVLDSRSEEHTSELQSLRHLVCRLLLEKKNDTQLLTALSDPFISVLSRYIYRELSCQLIIFFLNKWGPPEIYTFSIRAPLRI